MSLRYVKLHTYRYNTFLSHRFSTVPTRACSSTQVSASSQAFYHEKTAHQAVPHSVCTCINYEFTAYLSTDYICYLQTYMHVCILSLPLPSAACYSRKALSLSIQESRQVFVLHLLRSCQCYLHLFLLP